MKLLDVLPEKSIGLDEIAENWQHAMKLAGEYLMKNEGIEERYIDAMISAVETIGPYMVVAPGIAIAHARPEDGAIKICLSLVRLKNPVNFGSKSNDPVDLIFGLAGVDHDSHISILRDLASLLQNKNAINTIRKLKSTEEIVQYLRNL